MKSTSFELTVNRTEKDGSKVEVWKGNVDHSEPETISDLNELVESGKYTEASIMAVFNAGDRVARQTRIRPIVLKAIAENKDFDPSALNAGLNMSESAIRTKSTPAEKIMKAAAGFDASALTESQKAEIRAKLGL